MATLSFDPPHVENFEPSSAIGELRSQRIRAAVSLTLIFWLSNYIIQTLGTILSGKAQFAEIAGMRLLSTVFGLGLCYGIHLILRRLPTTRKRLIALAIVSPIAAEIFAWAAFFAQLLVDPTISLNNFSWFEAVRTISFWTWFFLAWAGLYLTVSYGFDVREEQQRTAEMREGAYVAQLRALHSQINPHFLFNSLNSLSALILNGEASRAEEMVSKLAQFLRLGLAADPMEQIRLASELELQQTYLELEQLRYEDLDVRIWVPEDLLTANVPALILQPIIENAVKYGVADAAPPASIVIRGWNEGNRLFLEVRDSGCGASKTTGTGIGLANVRQRLRLLYGPDRAELTTSKIPGGGFRALLILPLRVA